MTAMTEVLPPVVASAREAFQFWGCTEIRESLGIRADSERHLIERLETVPPESIYYHTVRSLLRRRVVPGPYPNDFANWVAVEVRDSVLAERLAFNSPFDFHDMEEFREHLLATLDDHLSRLPFAPRGITGRPFFFLRGHLAAVPLAVEAPDLRSFRTAMASVDESSIYYHWVESIGRLGNPRGDFAAWVEDALGLPGLARRFSEIDPFVLSLAAVRTRVLGLLDEQLTREGDR